MMVARKKLRAIAYTRYRKYFDPGSISYFYEDRKNYQVWIIGTSRDRFTSNLLGL
jgi:hypothetical protein